MSTTIAGPDGKSRRRYCGVAPEFLDYHDIEWEYIRSVMITAYSKN